MDKKIQNYFKKLIITKKIENHKLKNYKRV